MAMIEKKHKFKKAKWEVMQLAEEQNNKIRRGAWWAR
jgi:hypothetical protein